jgi:hypothetical protein
LDYGVDRFPGFLYTLFRNFNSLLVRSVVFSTATSSSIICPSPDACITQEAVSPRGFAAGLA